MSKKHPKNGTDQRKPHITLPKDVLNRVNLGQSFAEYDRMLLQPGVFVNTPATQAAQDSNRSKCFFVGRRGTGKTAITCHFSANQKTALTLHPQVFNAINVLVDVPLKDLRDVNQRTFRSLVECFKRALEDEVLLDWIKCGYLTIDTLPPQLRSERNYLEQLDFDLRMFEFVASVVEPLLKNNEKEWLKQIKKAKDICKSLADLANSPKWNRIVMIDRIDDSWDGSDKAVILLMALMHACVELNSAYEYIRPLLFLRENIFERVRHMDNEFPRLETCVVSLDWTTQMLVEMIERRLQYPLNPKPAIGETWDYFFENVASQSSRSLVFDYCQQRPRDILTYCELALESARSKRHNRVLIEDLQAARHRFSENRYKDLCDEYSENYHQLQLALGRFHGLGAEFTIPGIDSFIRKLLVDNEIQKCCPWIYNYTTPHQFIEWLYGIGFAGLRLKGRDSIDYRSLGARSTLPPIDATTSVVIHPTYADALSLQNLIISSLDDVELRKEGVLFELPEAIDRNAYASALAKILEDIKVIELGKKDEARFEDWVGEVIRLCFFRALTNVEPQKRDVEGRVRRDWIAANRATSGFWEMVRSRYNATQIVFECKNYEDLEADDFHQIAYYLTKPIGMFGIIVFRGDVVKHYYGHIKRIAEKDALVLLLSEKDMLVFVRQAINGKVKESHIQDNYDRTVREIS
jgi:hypothetical protein